MESTYLKLNITDRVALVTIDRPEKKNALSLTPILDPLWRIIGLSPGKRGGPDR